MTAASLGLFQSSLAVFGWMSAGARHLADTWGSLQDVSVAISRVLEMLSMPAAERVASGSLVPGTAVESIAFEAVNFGYDSRSQVLNQVCFEARVGELTALAGASGSGKTTILGLLLRFFDPDSGRILFNGVPIEHFALPAWRSTLSVALQENPLFTATLRDNLTYGRPQASDAEVNIAIERAALRDFVHSLPAGLNTLLGEKGAKLSAGQAQRIGLARALLRDAPILLLDEPTSALDGRTEEIVVQGIRSWLAEAPARRLVILVTHRRGSASKADRVYRVEQGKLELHDDAALREAESSLK